MRIKALSGKIVALKLKCSVDEVVETLQKQPQLMRELFDIEETDKFIIRFGSRRTVILGDGNVVEEFEKPEDKRLVLETIAVIKPTAIKSETEQVLRALRDDEVARERFKDLFPERYPDFRQYIENSGCSMCRGKMGRLLEADDPRVGALKSFLSGRGLIEAS